MTTRTLKSLVLEVMIVSFMFFGASPAVLSSPEKTVLSENSPASRVLYLNDSWSDMPKNLLPKTRYQFTEIRKVEVERDVVIICANDTLKAESTYSWSFSSNYLIFFDTNNDNVTELRWRYSKTISGGGVKNHSDLYRFSDDALYYNGAWHQYTTYAPDFNGTVTENVTTGETAFHLAGLVKGTVKIKVASMVQVSGGYSTIQAGDFAPGGNFTNAAKIGKNFGPTYKNACDVIFPYNNETVELREEELPPPPPPPLPPPEEAHLNIFLQMAVWAMQAAVWIKEGIINLPSWIRDNAVTGSLIVTVLVFSSYSLVKKWRINKQRLKRALDSVE